MECDLSGAQAEPGASQGDTKAVRAVPIVAIAKHAVPALSRPCLRCFSTACMASTQDRTCNGTDHLTGRQTADGCHIDAFDNTSIPAPGTTATETKQAAQVPRSCVEDAQWFSDLPTVSADTLRGRDVQKNSRYAGTQGAHENRRVRHLHGIVRVDRA